MVKDVPKITKTKLFQNCFLENVIFTLENKENFVPFKITSLSNSVKKKPKSYKRVHKCYDLCLFPTPSSEILLYTKHIFCV